MSLSLHWKMILCFLFCAIITALSSLFGIFSLHQIQSNMVVTTSNIGGNIENQNVMMLQVIKLRQIINGIENSKNISELQKTEKSLQQFVNSSKSIVKLDYLDQIIKETKILIQNKTNQLKALVNLSEISATNENLLKKINAISTDIADSAEFDSTIKIEDSITDVKQNIDTLSKSTTKAISTIKSALQIHSYGNALNSLVKDTQISKDKAVVEYTQISILNMIQKMQSILKGLDSNENTTIMLQLLDTLSENIKKMLAEKIKLITTNNKIDDTVKGTLSEIKKKAEKSIHEIIKLSMSIVDNVEFDAMLVSESISDETKANSKKLLLTTEKTISNIKNAMFIHSEGNKVNSLLQESLISNDKAMIDYAGNQITDTLNQATGRVNQLESNETISKIKKSIDDIKAFIPQIIETKKKLVDTVKNNSQSFPKKLNEYKKQYQAKINEIQALSTKLVDDIDFDSMIAIDESITNIQSNIQKISSESEKNLKTVSNALSLRANCFKLDSQLINALSTEDSAFLKYQTNIISEIFTLINKTINELPKNETTQNLLSAIETFQKISSDILKLKSELLSTRNITISKLIKDLEDFEKKNHQSLTQMTKLAMSIVDNIEFDSTILIEDATTSTQDNFKNMSGTVTSALGTVKSALSIRSLCSVLDSKFKDAIFSKDLAFINYTKEQIHTVIAKINNTIENLAKSDTAKITDVLKPLSELMKKLFSDINTLRSSEKNLSNSLTKINDHMEKINTFIIDASKSAKSEADDTLTKSKKLIRKSSLVLIIFGSIAFFLSILAGITIARSIFKPIGRIIDVLNDSSREVSTSAHHVSSASLNLAEGAEKQNYLLKTTASPLSTIATNSQQCVSNTENAGQFMKDVMSLIMQAQKDMDTLNESMNTMVQASEETFKVIKIIDEIAFQTNLLALNAAVEAARAGEKGAGFAIVAEEVRNLAMRSTEAAKNTSDMIGSTVSTIKESSEVVISTKELFEKIAFKTKSISTVVEEMVLTFNDVSSGIEEVATGIDDVERIVHMTAENAQETASVSEEMNAQAENMKEVVDNLVVLIYGANSNKNNQNDLYTTNQISSESNNVQQIEFDNYNNIENSMNNQPAIEMDH